ncbi:uncharacterized protein MYCFIDRAFT_191768 [Pseudocercospora fijiensis CIRAD86]|uniref:Uncharacterized protein n=1 Tax=Pseudocercospora fijiensis (strain CIRAD86) TaxID=383855 RepID=N1Q8P1_PSEFD|nr:uncharacterized protein MYCFIDRAFT_191768 [Pseudocercospora fijiensis CIRAD86]EME87292.1 hypothetical protein MYCFIDRAFT_191768 [Pseudocercospora fijiensis CIRAD86]
MPISAQADEQHDSPAKASTDNLSVGGKERELVDEKLTSANDKQKGGEDQKPKIDLEDAFRRLTMSSGGTATFPGSNTGALPLNYYQQIITECIIDAMPDEAQRHLFHCLIIAIFESDSSKEIPYGTWRDQKSDWILILKAVSGKNLEPGKPEHSLDTVEDQDRQKEIVALNADVVQFFQK